MRWLVVLLVSAAACETAVPRTTIDGGGGSDLSLADGDVSGPDLSAGVDLGPTWGLACGAMVPKITGQVLAPNGDPVPSAAVYVVREVVPIVAGVGCDLCGNPSGADSTWVDVQTGIDGRFELDLSTAPLSDLKLAVRKGRFRRVTTLLPTCGTVPIPAQATTLPGRASDGDMPRIAAATGNVDRLDLLLVELGIESFDCYEGTTSGTKCAMPQASGQRVLALLKDRSRLDGYNVLLLSCAPNIWSSYSGADRATVAGNLRDWVGRGGRLFVTDHSYDYISQSWPDAITWHGAPRVSPAPWPIGMSNGGGANVGLVPSSGSTYDGVVDHPDITAWLKLPEIGVSSAPNVAITGWLDPWSVQKSLPMDTRRIVHGMVDWSYGGSGRTSEDLPLTSQFIVSDCGRVIYSSYHTTSTIGGTMLTPQERVLEYLLLDIASCLPTIL